jgi:hypothetical protein
MIARMDGLEPPRPGTTPETVTTETVTSYETAIANVTASAWAWAGAIALACQYLRGMYICR